MHCWPIIGRTSTAKLSGLRPIPLDAERNSRHSTNISLLITTHMLHNQHHAHEPKAGTAPQNPPVLRHPPMSYSMTHNSRIITNLERFRVVRRMWTSYS